MFILGKKNRDVRLFCTIASADIFLLTELNTLRRNLHLLVTLRAPKETLSVLKYKQIHKYEFYINKGSSVLK